MISAKDKAIKFFKNCDSDRGYFGRTVLKSVCWDKQMEIKQALRDYDFVEAVSSHGVGKTYVAADIIVEFLYTHKDSYVITTATTATQVKNILWAEINAKFRNNKNNLDIIAPGRCLTVELKIGDQWKAIGLSPRKDTGTDVATAMQGYHAEDILVVIDEAGGVEKAIWDAIHGLLTSYNAKLLAIGNPTHVGTEFHKIFKNKPKNWKIIQINTLDLPNITEVYGKFKPTREGCGALVDAYEKQPNLKVPYPKLTTAKWFAGRWHEWGYDNPLFQSRVLGRFPNKSEDSVFNATALEEARHTEIKLQNNNIGRVLGVDVARYGDDRSCFIPFQTGQILDIKYLQGKSVPAVSAQAGYIINNRECERVGVDDVGVGGGVTDILREQGFSVSPFIANAVPMNDRDYMNLKAEMYFELAKAFDHGEIAFPEETPENKDLIEKLIADLLNIRYKIQIGSNKLMIVSKDDMKKKGIPSPDFAEALIIAFWLSRHGATAEATIRANTDEGSSHAQDELAMMKGQSEGDGYVSDFLGKDY